MFAAEPVSALFPAAPIPKRMAVDGGNSTLQRFQLCTLRDKQQKTTICVYKYTVTEPRGAAEELASIGRQIYLRK